MSDLSLQEITKWIDENFSSDFEQEYSFYHPLDLSSSDVVHEVLKSVKEVK